MVDAEISARQSISEGPPVAAIGKGHIETPRIDSSQEFKISKVHMNENPFENSRLKSLPTTTKA